MLVTIYALRDPRTKEIRYVGKTIDVESRIRSHRWEKQSSKLHTYKINWLRTLKSEPIFDVLQQVPYSKWEKAERYWIAKLRKKGCRLTNFADGGQTSPVEGKGHTEASKQKMRQSALKNKACPPSRKGMSAWNKNTRGLCKRNSTSFTKGQTPWNKGKTMSKELIEKNRAGHVGIPWSKARWAAQKRRK